MQFGFLEGRLIHEVIGATQETLHLIARNSSPIFIMKIDLLNPMKGCHSYFKTIIIAFGPLVGYDEMDYELHLLNVLLSIDNGVASPFFLS